MRLSRQSLILGTVVLSLVLCALAWFLLISPKRDEAAATRDETAVLTSANDLLAVEVADLRDKFSRLDEYKGQLAAAQIKVPTDLSMATVVAELELAAIAHGVTLAEVTPADGQTLRASAGGAAPADATPAADGTTPTPSSPVAEELVAFPVTITVYGSYDETTAFVSLVQTIMERYVLVSGTQIEALGEAAPLPDGTPALEPGDLKMIVNGFVFALPAQAPDAAGEEGEPLPLPLRPEGKDIIVPQPVAAG